MGFQGLCPSVLAERQRDHALFIVRPPKAAVVCPNAPGCPTEKGPMKTTISQTYNKHVFLEGVLLLQWNETLLP